MLKSISARVAAVGGVLAVPTLALAEGTGNAGDAAWNAALTSVTTSSVAYAGALVGVAAGVVVVMIAMKFVKRLRSAV
jgi:hypothetical protein